MINIVKDSEPINIFHFYHIYADGAWQNIVEEHINVLRKTGLYEKLDYFGIGFVGSQENINIVKEFLSSLNVDYVSVFESDENYGEQWEQETLDKLLEFSKENEGYILYAHTKGAANNFDFQNRWRKRMTLYNIVEWENATSALYDYDTAGCYLCTPEKNGEHVKLPFYGGNFWWATTKFVSTLNYPNRDNRWDAEAWIGLNPDINPYDLSPGWPSPELFETDITL